MKEVECIQSLQQMAEKLLQDTGIVEILSTQAEPKRTSVVGEGVSPIPDFVINVRTKDKEQYSLLFEVKSIGQPRYARLAVNQLQTMTSQRQNAYGIFGAPYISEETMAICRENEIGFMDIGGNCFLKFNNIYINIQGKPNPYPATRPLRSLFAQKSTRALRVLLCTPKGDWTVQDLAREADISLGQASNVKKKLLENEFIEEDRNKKFRMFNPEALLKKWAENYTYRKNKIKDYYSFDEIRVIEEKLASYCESNNIPYAFTLTSGASLVAPFLRYTRVFAYVMDSFERITQELGWKGVSSGPNISILEPYDEGVFYGLQSLNGIKVVCDPQLYLDLLSYRERGEEAARFLLENRLRTQW